MQTTPTNKNVEKVAALNEMTPEVCKGFVHNNGSWQPLGGLSQTLGGGGGALGSRGTWQGGKNYLQLRRMLISISQVSSYIS